MATKDRVSLIKFNKLQVVIDNNVLQFVIGDNDSKGVIDDITGYPSG